MFDEITLSVLDFYRFFSTPVLPTDIIGDGGFLNYASPPHIFFYFRNKTFSRALPLDSEKTR
jgi:hypothetical protein